MYIFDFPLAEKGIFEVKYKLPFDATQLSEEERQREFGNDSPLEFSHSLEDQIGGQLEAGFVLTGLYEDQQNSPLGEVYARVHCHTGGQTKGLRDCFYEPLTYSV